MIEIKGKKVGKASKEVEVARQELNIMEKRCGSGAELHILWLCAGKARRECFERTGHSWPSIGERWR